MKQKKVKKIKKIDYFNLNEEYKKSWNYIKESKNFIYTVIGVFFVFSLIGFFLPAPEIVSDYILEFLEEILEKTAGMSNLELIKFIFINNLQSSFSGMIFGFLFGILPILAMVTNGYLLGFVSSIALENKGILVLLRLLPHGIFELPAIFISVGLGLRFGTFVFQKNKLKSFKDYLGNSLRVFLLVVVPLLIIAAIIEGSLIS